MINAEVDNTIDIPECKNKTSIFIGLRKSCLLEAHSGQIARLGDLKSYGRAQESASAPVVPSIDFSYRWLNQ